MKRSKFQIAFSALLLIAALVFAAMGIWGFSLRQGSLIQESLSKMRSFAVLRTASGVVVDAEALAARSKARAFAKENKFSRSQTTSYISEKENEARSLANARYASFEQVDFQKLEASVLQFESALSAWSEQVALEREAFAESWKEKIAAEAEKVTTESSPQTAEVGEAVNEDELMEQPVDTVDYSGFVQSEKAAALEEAARPAFNGLFTLLKEAIPLLPDDVADDLRTKIQLVLSGANASYEDAFDRYQSVGALDGLDSSTAQKMQIARDAKNLLLYAAAVLLIALVLFYAQILKKKFGMPRLIISTFFVLLLIAAGLYNISVTGMLGTILWRTGMYGVLALAMLPGIQSGISLNMGMTVGIISGLLSTLIAMESNMTGWGAFAFAVIGAIILSVPVGWLYGLLLNRLKGSEMTISTYVGFSYVSLFCIFWMILPFKNPALTWALGGGLRTMHNMSRSFGRILDSLWSFELFGTKVPTGLILFFLLCCLLLWLFSRSKMGSAMIAAGANPRFAEAAGINVNKMRIVGTILSTVVAAVGIIVYSQSFGFMQLYAGPRQMGFVAASAILIGGATVSKAKVSHVILGTFLFQGVLALGIQVANAAISEGGLSEIMRILISNGIILYALTQSGGGGRD